MVEDAVLPCDDLDATIRFFTGQLGFRLDLIMPADDPAIAVVSGHGLRLRLMRPPTDGCAGGPAAPPTFELTHADDGAGGIGRAGMHYRDVVPSRQGGRMIASHIVIADGGPVPDYVHFHDVRLQLIYGLRGWARLVYEDQGPPFVLHAGDCVLQPPGIRHRVLESSPGLEVVEVTCPAAHPTHVDHDLALPTPDACPDRSFGGQRFVHHVASGARWTRWRWPGFEARDTGVGEASRGVARVHVVRATESAASMGVTQHDGALVFWYVVAGTATLTIDGRPDERLGPGDAVVIPGRLDYALTGCSDDFELLDVTLSDAAVSAVG